MKKKNIIKIGIVVVAIAAVAGGGYYYYKNTAKAALAKNAPKYISSKAKKGSIDVTITATGTVSAATSDDIISFNNGIISNINLKEGDTVKKGQTIGFIDDTNMQQSVNLAQLKVQTDNVNISNNKDPNKSDSLNLQLQQDQSDLNTKTEQLAKETITSPIDGVIVTMDFKNGDTVQSGKTVATVVDMKSLQLVAQVDELDIPNVKNGQKAQIQFDALSGKKFTGTVTKIAVLGKTTNNVTTYDVSVSIDNSDGIKIGMNANINISVASKDNVLTVPIEAVQTINGKKYVLTSIPTTTTSTSKSTSGNGSAASTTRNRSGNGSGSGSSFRNNSSSNTSGNYSGRITSNMKEVTTGLANQSEIEIVSGLNEGNSVYILVPNVSSTTNNSSNRSGVTGSNFSGGNQNYGGASGAGSRTSGSGGN